MFLLCLIASDAIIASDQGAPLTRSKKRDRNRVAREVEAEAGAAGAVEDPRPPALVLMQPPLAGTTLHDTYLLRSDGDTVPGIVQYLAMAGHEFFSHLVHFYTLILRLLEQRGNIVGQAHTLGQLTYSLRAMPISTATFGTTVTNYLRLRGAVKDIATGKWHAVSQFMSITLPKMVYYAPTPGNTVILHTHWGMIHEAQVAESAEYYIQLMVLRGVHDSSEMQQIHDIFVMFTQICNDLALQELVDPRLPAQLAELSERYTAVLKQFDDSRKLPVSVDIEMSPFAAAFANGDVHPQRKAHTRYFESMTLKYDSGVPNFAFHSCFRLGESIEMKLQIGSATMLIGSYAFLIGAVMKDFIRLYESTVIASRGGDIRKEVRHSSMWGSMPRSRDEVVIVAPRNHPKLTQAPARARPLGIAEAHTRRQVVTASPAAVPSSTPVARTDMPPPPPRVSPAGIAGTHRRLQPPILLPAAASSSTPATRTDMPPPPPRAKPPTHAGIPPLPPRADPLDHTDILPPPLRSRLPTSDPPYTGMPPPSYQLHQMADPAPVPFPTMGPLYLEMLGEFVTSGSNLLLQMATIWELLLTSTSVESTEEQATFLHNLFRELRDLPHAIEKHIAVHLALFSQASQTTPSNVNIWHGTVIYLTQFLCPIVLNAPFVETSPSLLIEWDTARPEEVNRMFTYIQGIMFTKSKVRSEVLSTLKEGAKMLDMSIQMAQGRQYLAEDTLERARQATLHFFTQMNAFQSHDELPVGAATRALYVEISEGKKNPLVATHLPTLYEPLQFALRLGGTYMETAFNVFAITMIPEFGGVVTMLYSRLF